MTTLNRVTAKLFAGNAPADEIGQFGSALAGTPTNTSDVATIQQLSAYSNGWGSAVISSRNFPPMEEVNGVLKTLSYQNCYLLQEGVPTYDAGTNYSNTSIVKSISGNELSFYISQEDNNLGNALSTDKWARAVLTASTPIGVPQFTLNFNATLPTGCTWLEGALDGIPDSGNTCYFPNLYAIYGTSYNTEDTPSGYYALPDFRDKVIWGASTSDTSLNTGGAGYIDAGLPNITGAFNGNQLQDGSSVGTGAFGIGGSSKKTTPTSDGDSSQYGFNIDASRSSSIYGNSTTVQPPAIKVRVYTRYE